MTRYNFHTHSHYDDGSQSLEDMVKGAIDAGLSAIGFSGHSPLPFENEWSISKKDYPEYLAEGRRLKEVYKHLIDVYLGLEIDYIPGYSDNFRAFMEDGGLDYCIGSVHLVMKPGSKRREDIWFIDGPREGYLEGIDRIFGGDARMAVEAYYGQLEEMVATQRPGIIGHLDKVNMHNREEVFDSSAPWYLNAVEGLLAAIARYGGIVEVNTRGIYTGKSPDSYPEARVLKQCLKRNIPVMVSTDAHHPEQLLSQFDEGVRLIGELGYTKMTTPFFEAAI